MSSQDQSGPYGVPFAAPPWLGVSGWAGFGAEDNSVISLSGAETVLLSSTQLLPSGVYLCIYSGWVQTAAAGSFRMRAGKSLTSLANPLVAFPPSFNSSGSPALANSVDPRTYTGQRVAFGVYFHRGGKALFELTCTGEGSSMTWGLSSDSRFGRKLLVVKIG